MKKVDGNCTVDEFGSKSERHNSIRSPILPACSESLYRLSYSGPVYHITVLHNVVIDYLAYVQLMSPQGDKNVVYESHDIIQLKYSVPDQALRHNTQGILEIQAERGFRLGVRL